MSHVFAIFSYEVKLSGDAGAWTDITADVIHAEVSGGYGIEGRGPLDCVASSGQCTFVLRNDASDSRPLGYYSPANSVCRSGWQFGILFRLRALYEGDYYTRFYGVIHSILPDTGVNGRRQVVVTAYDIIRDLAEANIQETEIQIGKTESELIQAVLDANLSLRPFDVDMDPGVDTFPYAFDNLGENLKALSVIADVARSSFALVAATGTGTLIVRNRTARTLLMSSHTFLDDANDVEVPSDLSNVFNLVRVTIHPKTLDSTFDTVLYKLVGETPVVPAGSTIELWGNYNDQSNAQALMGGLPRTPVLDSGTDYAANTLADGSGSDITADITVTADAFAASVKFTITNNGIVPAFLIDVGGTEPLLQIRGKGVYDRGPRTYQSYSVQPYGVRPIDIDMPYQDNGNVAQAAAEYVQAIWSPIEGTSRSMAESLTFIANISDDRMLFALTVEPGSIIRVLESVTSDTILNQAVQSVAFRIIERVVVYTLGLAPANVFDFWLWGVAGRSEWGETTIYGF